MKIEMLPVVSSNIAGMGYDEKSQTLRVEFNKGSTYDYLGVPKETYNILKLSDSVGSMLGRLVKGVYRFKKVLPEEVL